MRGEFRITSSPATGGGSARAGRRGMRLCSGGEKEVRRGVQRRIAPIPVYGGSGGSRNRAAVDGGRAISDNPSNVQPRLRGFPAIMASAFEPMEPIMARNYYSEINLHIVWHTKESSPLLSPAIEAE